MISRPLLAILAALFCTLPVAAHEFEHHSGFPEVPADWGTIGDGHGEIVVASSGEVYVSVMGGKQPGLQVYSPEGKYLRNVPGAPKDFHGFVIAQEDEGEFIYGVGLLSGTLTKMKLDGEVVFATPVSVIPEKFFWKKKDSDVINPRFTSCAVSPIDGTIYVADGYASDNIHLYNADGSYRETWVGRAEPYNFKNLHKIHIDPRYDEPRILGCDRANLRLVHLSLDGEFLGDFATGLRRPSAAAFHGPYVAIAEIQGRISVLDKDGNIDTTMGTNNDKYNGNRTPPEQWREGITTSPHGIAFDAEGNILMTEYSKWGRVLKYSQKPHSSATELIQGDILSSFRPLKDWKVAESVEAVPGEMRFEATAAEQGGAVLYNGVEKQRAPYLFTKDDFSDVSIQLEFMVPNGSNAGVYVMGRYEIQILDSFGKPEVKHSDLGGVYQRWRSKEEAEAKGIPQGYEGVAPKVNAAKAPGEWQTMEIVFRAPRFDADGNKTQNARFETVHVNGQLVQADVEVTGPTRAAPLRGDAAQGPIAIQGDHGPIAIRSYVVTPLADTPAE
ncbi:MAG: family 16 glycoside hydrolase [Planctomycetota bacterium]